MGSFTFCQQLLVRVTESHQVLRQLKILLRALTVVRTRDKTTHTLSFFMCCENSILPFITSDGS